MGGNQGNQVKTPIDLCNGEDQGSLEEDKEKIWEMGKTIKVTQLSGTRGGRIERSLTRGRNFCVEGQFRGMGTQEWSKKTMVENLRFSVGQDTKVIVRGEMEWTGQGRGSGGRRQSNQPGHKNYATYSVAPQRRSQRKMRKTIEEVERVYKEGTVEDIRRLIKEMEENVMEDDSKPEMEEWGDIIPNPRNTRGRMTRYKQALHVYQVLKRLLGRALEQVAGKMAELAQDMPNMKKEMKNLQITMIMQDSKLEKIHQQLKKLILAHRAKVIPLEGYEE